MPPSKKLVRKRRVRKYWLSKFYGAEMSFCVRMLDLRSEELRTSRKHFFRRGKFFKIPKEKVKYFRSIRYFAKCQMSNLKMKEKGGKLSKSQFAYSCKILLTKEIFYRFTCSSNVLAPPLALSCPLCPSEMKNPKIGCAACATLCFCVL